MNKYECVYIISTKLDGEATSAKTEKFSAIVTANGGTVESVDLEKLGRRKLAYPINYETEGQYVLMTFESEPELPGELERNLRNDENILRFLVVRVGE